MAAEVITLISSSPPLQMSPLGSPSRFHVKPKTQIKPGSRAAPIPEGAHVGFQSAASAFKNAGGFKAFAFDDGIVDEGVAGKSRGVRSRTKSKSPAVEDVIVDADETGRSAAVTHSTWLELDQLRRSPGADVARSMANINGLELETSEVKAKSPPSIFRKPSSLDGYQLVSPRVQAYDAEDQAESHRSTNRTILPPGPNEDFVPIDLMGSPLTRRLDLDEPIATAAALVSLPSELIVDTCANHPLPMEPPKAAARSLADAFAYTGGMESVAEPPAKRQRTTSEVQPALHKPVVAKQKSPTKKLTTITASAIANMHHDEEGNQPDTIMATIARLEPECVHEDVQDAKAKKTRKKKVKLPLPPPKRLPSPYSAIRRMERQEFVFGTSSQIRDEDVQYRLDLEKALDASDTAQNVLNDGLAPLSDRGRNLWAVSMRGDELPLMDAELRERRQKTRHGRSTEVDGKGADDFIDIDEVSPDSTAPSKKNDQLGVGLRLPATKSRLKLSSTPIMLSGPLMSISPNKPAVSRSYGTKAGTKDAVTKSKRKPKVIVYQGEPSCAEIMNAKVDEPKPEKEPRKSRAKAPTLDADGNPVKRPRGRPRKAEAVDPQQEADPETKPVKRRRVSKKQREAAEVAAAVSHIAADEIQDDVAPSPSPRRGKKTSEPKPLDLSQGSAQREAQDKARKEKEDAEAAAAAELAQAKLFVDITLTVKSEPRTKDPKKPSWYEKILLYDPIVLEDLAAWLNSKDLKTPDGKELKPVLVQKWCESNSICCLWREGLRGGVKKRY